MFPRSDDNFPPMANAGNPHKPLNSLLIKPAGPDCNLACSYCFYLEKSALFPQVKPHRMSLSTLEEVIRQSMIQAGPQMSFGWQGGEPTLMGLHFFEKAVEFQQRYGRGQSVGNGLQTNGLLLDGRWLTFLKRYNFLVGLSLDGPEHIHDKYRLNRGGKGSWKAVVEKARMLLGMGAAVNVLSAVNSYSVQFPEEIYRFHKEQGFDYMQFIPILETDPEHPRKAAEFSVSATDYGRFLISLFDQWIADFRNGQPTTSIRYFDALFYTYVGKEPPECTLLPECGSYLVVEHDGSVYSCDFFVEPRWQLGNVHERYLIDMLNSETQRNFGRRKMDLPPDCRTCPWLKHCRGGCPKDRQRDPLDGGLNHFCEAFKSFFAHADAVFHQLADQWVQEQNGFPLDSNSHQRDSEQAKTSRNAPCPCGSGKKFKQCCGTS